MVYFRCVTLLLGTLQRQLQLKTRESYQPNFSHKSDFGHVVLDPPIKAEGGQRK